MVCFCPCSVRVLDLVQERIQENPGDFQSMCIKSGIVKQGRALVRGSNRKQTRQGYFGSRKVMAKEGHVGVVVSSGESGKGGLVHRSRELAQVRNHSPKMVLKFQDTKPRFNT